MTEAADLQREPPRLALTFGKRVGIVAALFLVSRSVLYLLHFVGVAMIAYRVVPGYELVIYMAWNFLVACAVIAAVMLVLLHAQRRIFEGKLHWLATMSEPRLIMALVLAFLLLRLVPRVGWDSSLYADANLGSGRNVAFAFRGLSSAAAVAACYVWMWWCNGPPRAERLDLVAAMSWVGFEFMLDVLDLAVPTLNVLITRTLEPGWVMPLPGADAYVTFHARPWIWQVGFENLVPALISWFSNVMISTPIAAAVALVLYKLLNRNVGGEAARQ